MKAKRLILLLLAAFVVTSCSDTDIDGGKTVVPDPVVRNSSFDRWLYSNYIAAYNVEFQYWLDDFEMDPTYNLVPATEQQSKYMAFILKYAWFEAYDEVVGNVHFMRDNSPRLISLIGSSAINPETGTAVLGSAEGGIKMLLYDVNTMSIDNIDRISQGYLRTMHHEFAHILHQKKSYPQQEFNSVTPSAYSGNGWINLSEQDSWARGFVTNYASSEPREDFVETIAMYLTRSDEWWNNMLESAGETGSAAITTKLGIVTRWLRTQWQIDINRLQTIVRRRVNELPGLLETIDY